MPSPENIAQLQVRLLAHRDRLATLLSQHATFGSAYAPPAIVSGIREAREDIQQVKITLRGWGVLVEDLSDDTVPMLSQPLPIAGLSDPPTPTSLPSGLAGLARQLRTPEMHDELVEFRAIFSTARDQIGVLNRYKDLHDTLQGLERPFNIVARDRRRLADDPAAWDEIYQQITDLQDYARTALAIMSDPRLADESVWGRQQLQLASAELDQALAQTDSRLLDRSVGRYKRVLARELPRTDRRLATCAGDLRLGQVTQALGQVQSSLGGTMPDLGALRELATWTVTLNALHTRLDRLVPTHHRWQEVDSELRRVAESLTSDPTDLELAWGDLLLQTMPLFGSLSDDWAVMLNTLSAQIDQAFAEGAILQARRLFISYQSRATRRFVEVDKALLSTCNELREAGAALDVILRTLDEGTI